MGDKRARNSVIDLSSSNKLYSAEDVGQIVEKILTPIMAFLDKMMEKIESKFVKQIEVQEVKIYDLGKKYDEILIENNKLKRQLEINRDIVINNAVNEIKNQEESLKGKLTFTGLTKDKLGSEPKATVEGIIKNTLKLEDIGITNCLQSFYYKRGSLDKSFLLEFDFENPKDSYWLFKKAKQLQGTGIFLEQVHCKKINEQLVAMRRLAAALKHEGKQTKVIGLKLIVDGEVMQEAMRNIRVDIAAGH